MFLSELLKQGNIDHKCYNEKQFDSLGLVSYNHGENVCTFLDDIKYLKTISSNVVMVITDEETAEKMISDNSSFGICIVENPRKAFFQVHNILASKPFYCQAIKPTITGEKAKISPLAVIAENNVMIGNNVIVEEFCVIRENTIIEDNSIIRAGCQIGGTGFEFKRSGDEIFGIAHVGTVIIGKNVEIQYNACIDKAIYPWDATIIGDYVKIDNLVHIGHAAKIGNRTMVVANSGIGGRAEIGEDCWIGFNSTIRNGLKIGNRVRVNMGAVVTKDVFDNDQVSGNFAIQHDKFIQHIKRINSLTPEEGGGYYTNRYSFRKEVV